MIIVTTEGVAGHRTVRTIGQVFGVVVRSRGLGGNIWSAQSPSTIACDGPPTAIG